MSHEIDMRPGDHWMYRGHRIAPSLATADAETARIDGLLDGGSRVVALADEGELTEKAFQEKVVALAKACGWLVYHTFDARRSEPGFPDLILIRGEYMLAVELKTAAGKVTEAQQKWITAFARVGDVDARVWRPNDWPEIESMVR